MATVRLAKELSIIYKTYNYVEFQDKQLAAALKAGHAMVEADGRVDPKEVEILFGGLAERLGTALNRNELVRMADEMETVEMISILSALDEGHKKYIAGYLASIMVSDGDIDDMEMRLWQLLSNLCAFPKMTLRQALDFWFQED